MSGYFEASPWDPIDHTLDDPAAVWGAPSSEHSDTENEQVESNAPTDTSPVDTPPVDADVDTPTVDAHTEETPTEETTTEDTTTEDTPTANTNSVDADANPYSEQNTTVEPQISTLSLDPSPRVHPKPKPRKTRNSGLKFEEVNSDPLLANDTKGAPKPTTSTGSTKSGDFNGSGSTTLPQPSSVHTTAKELRQYSAPTNAAPTPTFKVSVFVEETTSTHTVYKIEFETDHPDYDPQTSVVYRRYRQFRTLYKLLAYFHPGIVIPPAPDKQALGKFEDDFIQQRRHALQIMLQKILNHPSLRVSATTKAFLQAEDFQTYVESISADNPKVKSALNASVNDASIALAEPTSVFGFLGDTLGKRPSRDQKSLEYQKRAERLEFDLQSLLKSLFQVRKQRQYVRDSLKDFASVTSVLAEVEPTKNLVKVLKQFSKCHEKIAGIYEKVNANDMLNLEAVLDEQMRVVNSLKTVIVDRDVTVTMMTNAERSLEKAQRKNAKEEEIEQLTKQLSRASETAARISQTVDQEFKRVSNERIQEISVAIEEYTKNMIEAKQEIIEIWERFYDTNFA